MLVSLDAFKGLISQAVRIFVLVRLTSEQQVYLNITKASINEYLQSPDRSQTYEVDFTEDNELFIGE
jgi:hypothetical protein